MTRDARLYYLHHKDWKPLVAQVERHRNYDLKDLIVIFGSNVYPPIHSYTILSMHPVVDNIIEEYGGFEATPDDLMRNALHQDTAAPLYGEKSRIVYLNKI